MRPELFISSVLLSVILLALIAWKWRVSIRTAVFGGIVIGVITGFLVSWIDSAYAGLNIGFLLIIEVALALMLAAIAVMTRFYRDPERHPRETENVILSPADGKVVYVNNVEKGSSLGGTIRFAEHVPFKADLHKFRKHLEYMLQASGAAVMLNTEVTPEFVARQNPDVLIAAVGTTPIVPDIPGIHSEKVVMVMIYTVPMSKHGKRWSYWVAG